MTRLCHPPAPAGGTTEVGFYIKKLPGGAFSEWLFAADRTALRGRYASEEDRSQARAEQVAAQLAKEAGLSPNQIQSFAYAPVVIGAPSPNGIEVHVELK